MSLCASNLAFFDEFWSLFYCRISLYCVLMRCFITDWYWDVWLQCPLLWYIWMQRLFLWCLNAISASLMAQCNVLPLVSERYLCCCAVWMHCLLLLWFWMQCLHLSCLNAIHIFSFDVWKYLRLWIQRLLLMPECIVCSFLSEVNVMYKYFLGFKFTTVVD